MNDLVTTYSEIIEDIVTGKFLKHVMEQRKTMMLRELIGKLEQIQASDTTGQIRITENLLRFIDTTDGFDEEKKMQLPISYRKYFFTSNNESMELINDFVLAANEVFAKSGLAVTITTAKVAARLRGQFLHLLTSAQFERMGLELSVVNNGLVTFIVEDPKKTISLLEKYVK